jgi:AraC family transcriptional regulator
VAGVGRVLLWSGGSLWICRQAGLVEPHAHHAVQVTLAIDAPFRMRGDATAWREHHGTIVRPHHTHQFDGCGRAALHLFVEPETVQGRSLLQRVDAAEMAHLDARQEGR